MPLLLPRDRHETRVILSAAPTMPQYTIMHDRPWIEEPGRASLAPSASVYSEDDYQTTYRDSKMPEVPPLKLHKLHHQQPAGPSHNVDHDAPTRQSKMLLFKQVKSMLHKPSKLDMSKIGRPRDNSLTRGSSATEARNASGTSTRDGYEVRKNWSDRETASSKDASPVSALSDMEKSIPPGSGWRTIQYEDHDQVSEVADFAYRNRGAPSQVSASTRSYATPDTPCPTARLSSTKRKPTPRSVSQTESYSPALQSPSPPPSRDNESESVVEIARYRRDPGSRFSWTTYAGSDMCGRPSFDIASRPSMERPSTGRSIESQPARQPPLSRLQEEPTVSRFSWSTVGTGAPNFQTRPESPPPSPPPAQIPAKYKVPPVQSILSRHRPVQRQQEREEWKPQSRKASATDPDTPVIARLKTDGITNNQHQQRFTTDETPGSASKTLPPLPPDMSTSNTPKTHLEGLLAKEEEIIFQRKNIEKAIVENAKIESASPLDVTFSEVRAAKKELESLRARLEEIKLEERDMGIAIARARRKGGFDDGEGLWVRRVTG
ncbi:hypothetical protein CB0940_06379 [Cercospora beticola]|uniref:Uncharacterized protein n=2 Tax=Cercospora beticola TaxID=122368 RepID=A0A2G5I0A0_CERBT|nr:hypothetical protein CB0940_06379 [Cercospora beticola]PIA98190.1 hypothetical protein CB0940_06379 [Cercospora beticola]CAK1360314.1 unnamed protein product [Cercospora beticola]